VYILPADKEEDDRLSLQHNILKKAYEGRLVFPPIALVDGSYVLDNGCGTVIWSIEFVQKVSDKVLVKGIDIESGMFPAKLPSNIELSVGSMLDLPAEWTNKFALVNQRLLMAALSGAQWEVALKEVFRVTAPGGWAQFGEVGNWRAGPISEGHHDMMEIMYAKRGLLLHIMDLLPGMLEKAGFKDIRTEKRVLPLGSWEGPEGARVCRNFINVYRAMKSVLLNYGGLGYVKSESEFEDWLDRVEKEWNETKGSELEFYVFYAQKPVA